MNKHIRNCILIILAYSVGAFILGSALGSCKQATWVENGFAEGLCFIHPETLRTHGSPLQRENCGDIQYKLDSTWYYRDELKVCKKDTIGRAH